MLKKQVEGQGKGDGARSQVSSSLGGFREFVQGSGFGVKGLGVIVYTPSSGMLRSGKFFFAGRSLCYTSLDWTSSRLIQGICWGHPFKTPLPGVWGT